MCIPAVALPLTWWRHAIADRVVLGRDAVFYPFNLIGENRFTLGTLLTLLNYADHVVWGVFALIAVFILGRRKTHTFSRQTKTQHEQNRGL